MTWIYAVHISSLTRLNHHQFYSQGTVINQLTMDQEDLTASHWDDVISPHTPPTYNVHNNLAAPALNNEFNDLSVNDSEEDEEDEENETEPPAPQTPKHGHHDTEQEQQHELDREERKDHKNTLLSELTHGSDDHVLDPFIKSPERVKPSESLFNDKDSPLKVPDSVPADTHMSSPQRSSNLKNSKYKPARLRKFSSKTVVKHLDGDDQNKAPLGPLGDSDEANPEKRTAMSSDNDNGFHNDNNNHKDMLVQQIDAPLYEINNDSSTANEQSGKHRKHSLSIEDDSIHARNASSDLEITVGDPMKVGDITNAHIVYAIKTKNKNPESEYFPKDTDTVTVSRRYKDFRWIYHQLQNSHPGKIIPPPPTKQTYIGRFNENFIENRRLSLEKMLHKISHNSSLHHDPDFIMFLISEDFNNESKERERLSGSGASLQNDEYLDNESNNTNDASAPVITGGNSGGFMSSIFSMSQKIEEPDEYFIHKKEYIENLEYNLKVFYNSIELLTNQRLEMVNLVDEISLTIDELASLEILKVTTNLLGAFSDVQMKLKDNLDRINLQDQLTLGFTIEEYLRIIGSIKLIFGSRTKIYQQYYNFNQEYIKKQAQLNKLNKKFKMQPEKVNQLNFEVDRLKLKVQSFEKNFNTITSTIKAELEKFEFEKIDDFRNSVEIFIESSIESQKESIELWETFYERQNLSKV